MKKKIISLLILLCIFCLPAFCWKKKQKSTLILSSNDPLIYDSFDKKTQENRYFKKGSKIYYLIQNPNDFKSNFIKMQIVKQDDNAHMGGYSIAKNQTIRVKNKNYHSDYFILHQCGKYYLQIFDIEDTNHWLNLEGFKVIDE